MTHTSVSSRFDQTIGAQHSGHPSPRILPHPLSDVSIMADCAECKKEQRSLS